MAKRVPKPSPSSRALKALFPDVLEKMTAKGVHQTETYRYAAGTVTPSADRAALIESVTEGAVLANGWTPDGTATAATGTDDAKAS